MDTTYTFTYNGARITLARRTNRHALMIDRIMLLLDDCREVPGVQAAANDGSAVEINVDTPYQRTFAGMLVQTQAVEGELGFELISAAAPADEIRAAYQRFLDDDGVLGDAYYHALKVVNAPPGPREYQPADTLSEEERKNSPSAGSPGANSDVPSSAGSPAKKTSRG